MTLCILVLEQDLTLYSCAADDKISIDIQRRAVLDSCASCCYCNRRRWKLNPEVILESVVNEFNKAVQAEYRTSKQSWTLCFTRSFRRRFASNASETLSPASAEQQSASDSETDRLTDWSHVAYRRRRLNTTHAPSCYQSTTTRRVYTARRPCIHDSRPYISTSRRRNTNTSSPAGRCSDRSHATAAATLHHLTIGPATKHSLDRRRTQCSNWRHMRRDASPFEIFHVRCKADGWPA